MAAGGSACEKGAEHESGSCKKRGLHLLAAAFAIFYVFVSLFPLLFSLLSSFKNNTTIYAAPFALPEALDLENYRYALGGTSLLRGMDKLRFYIPCCPSR